MIIIGILFITVLPAIVFLITVFLVENKDVISIYDLKMYSRKMHLYAFMLMSLLILGGLVSLIFGLKEYFT